MALSLNHRIARKYGISAMFAVISLVITFLTTIIAPVAPTAGASDDTVAPLTAPSITHPTPRMYFNSTPIRTTWTAVTGASKYRVAYRYDDDRAFTNSTCPDETINGAAVYCRDTNWVQYRDHTPELSEQGGVTIWVKAISASGNQSKWSNPVHYYYDSVSPTTTLKIHTTANGLVGKKFTVSGLAEDNVSLNRAYVQLVKREGSVRQGGHTVYFPNLTSQNWSKEYDVALDGLSEGAYAAHVSIVDRAGNSTSVGWTDNFTIDTTRPTISDISISNGDYLTRDDIITFVATDNLVLGKIVANIKQNGKVVSGGNNAKWSSNKTDEMTVRIPSDLADGSYLISINALDEVGNRSTTHNISFAIDNTKPVVKLNLNNRQNYVNSGDYVSKINQPEVESHDANLDRFEIWRGDNLISTATATYSFRLANINHLKDGQYIVRAYDKVGNVSDDFIINMDSTAPTGTISYSPSELTNRSVTVTLTTSEPIIQASLPGTWNKKSETVYQKVYPINAIQEVTLEDRAGNKSVVEVKIDWIDKTAPKATITNPTVSFVSGKIKVVGQVDDANPKNSHFEINGPNGYKIASTRYDGQTHHELDWDTTKLADGEYVISFETRDKAGNKEGTIASPGRSVAVIKVVVDNTAPTLKINLNRKSYIESGDLTSQKFTPEIEAQDDNLDRIEVWQGDKKITSWSSDNPSRRAKIDWLQDGEYVIRALDKAGNASTDFVINLESVLPNATLTSSHDNPTLNDEIVITGLTDADDLGNHWFEITPPAGKLFYKQSSGAADKTFSFKLDTSAGAGEYKIRYVVTDKAGNRNDDPNYLNPTILAIEVAPRVEQDGVPTAPRTVSRYRSTFVPAISETDSQVAAESADNSDEEVLTLADLYRARASQGEVLAATDENISKSNSETCYKILSICWWVWALVAAGVVLITYLVSRHIKNRRRR